MAGSALLTLYRSLTRHRLYALLNIGGLALGIAVFLALFLFVRFETSFERWLPDADQIWVVEDTWHIPGVPERAQPSSMIGMLDALRGDYPDIVGTRLMNETMIVRQGDHATSEQAAMVDSNFLTLLRAPLVAGDPARALADPDGVVLTQAAAARYFTSPNPLGQPLTLVIEGKPYAYHVTGVLKDPPKNSDLDLNILVPLVRDRANRPYWDHWGAAGATTFLKLPDAAAARAVEQKLRPFIDRHAKGNLLDTNELSETLIPLPDLHLSNPKDRIIVATLGIVGALTLLVALVNYVNLATARSGLRAREVAVRKVIGGTRRALIVQFLGESIATAALATLIGLALVEIALPFVNAAGGTSLAVRYWGAGTIAPALVLLCLGVGVVSGLYPAVVLSAFRPAAVLASARAPGGGRSGRRLRQALVVVQFGIAIAFMIGTFVLVAQTHHLRVADLGFDRDGLIVVSSFNDPALTDSQRATLKDTIGRLPGIVGTTTSENGPGDIGGSAGYTMAPPGAPLPHPDVITMPIGENFFSVYGVHLLAGRLLDRRHAADIATDDWNRLRNAVVNAAAVETFGFASPGDAIGKLIVTDGHNQARIVGVVSDFRLRSPQDPVPAEMYFLYPDAVPAPLLTVRYRGASASAAMAALGQQWHRVAPGIPFLARTAEDDLNQSYYKEDAQRSHLFTIGAVVAVLIGCIGLYGLAAFDTSRRVKEIGIRKTLGASTRDIMALLIGQFMRPVLIANLIAWPIAFVAMRHWLAGFDERVTLSPFFFLGASVIALLIATATILGQAWRVARAEPARALRYE